MTQVNGREMESKDAPHVSHGVRGRSRLVKVIFYFISFLVFVQNTKYILSKEYQRSQSWVLECKLNSYWSKLRLREKHDVLLFSFFTCPLVPKTLLTQKSDSIFVHPLLRYPIFPHISLKILFPLKKKQSSPSVGLLVAGQKHHSCLHHIHSTVQCYFNVTSLGM